MELCGNLIWIPSAHPYDIQQFHPPASSVCTEDATLHNAVAGSLTVWYTYVVLRLVCYCSAWLRLRPAFHHECSMAVSIILWKYAGERLIQSLQVAESSTTRKLMSCKIFPPCGRASNPDVLLSKMSFMSLQNISQHPRHVRPKGSSSRHISSALLFIAESGLASVYIRQEE